MIRRPAPRLAIPLLIGAIAVGGLGIAGLGYLFLHPSPAAVGVASAAPGTSQPSTATADPAGSPAGSQAAGSLDGTWNVDPSIGSFDYAANDFSGSFVGYRIDEQLANIGANTAVGRTPGVSGSLVVDGTSITSVDISADLSTLQSDDQRRDGQVGRLDLGTATFKLASPIELGSLPADGATVDATATGDLTIHGVTRRVEIPVSAKRSGDVVTVTGSIPIVFADYGVTPPTTVIAVSVEDHGIIEFQLQLSHA
ncbi:MAG: YceI family protein [Chloroflexota bacterium]